MSNVLLTHLAREDLKGIREHISVTLGNPVAAANVLKGITKQLRTLKSFPEMGSILLLEESPTIYRYLVHGNYMSFYHIQKNSVVVDRILYGRSDYLRLLLGDEWEAGTEPQ